MYCKCTADNNYIVVGLCNIAESGYSKISEQKPWVQIDIPEMFSLPACKPDIESIDEVIINVRIDSTKIIKTPVSPSANSEGMALTGRKLLVHGTICETVVYTANTPEQAVYAVDHNVPFCTFIVIPGDADVQFDRYCVKACVEDVYTKTLNCRTIFKNITLFLYTEKAIIQCPPKAVTEG